VTREPTAVVMVPTGELLSVEGPRASRTGSRTTRKPSTFALIHPGRSTMVAGPAGSRLVNPVKSRTWVCAITESSRSWATACRASARLMFGPGRTRRTPVLTATSQSIKVTFSPYPLGLRSLGISEYFGVFSTDACGVAERDRCEAGSCTPGKPFVTLALSNWCSNNGYAWRHGRTTVA